LRLPTSVLLAVLAAAGLLALAPALTRRYDATERVAAQRVASNARVLSRRRRRRTVPGRQPINPPSFAVVSAIMAAESAPARRNSPRRTRRGRSRRGRPRRPVSALHRRRRVFVALAVLTLVELAGVVLVSPGFWVAFAVSAAALVVDLVYLRRSALAAARRRRIRQRHLARIAAEQAAVRLEHERRAEQRRVAQRLAALERERVRREAQDYLERYGDLEPNENRERYGFVQRYGSAMGTDGVAPRQGRRVG
jgi:hypothetical protein